MDRTLAIIKPDVVDLGLEGEVLKFILAEGFRVVALRRGRASAETWGDFYRDHRGRPFFDDLVSFMAGGDVVALVLESPGWPSAVSRWRSLIGATDPRVAAPGTLRELYGNKGGVVFRNVVHGSATAEEAKRELSFWFTQAELQATRELREMNALDEPPLGGLRSLDLGDLRPVILRLNEEFNREHYAGETLAPVLLRKLDELVALRAASDGSVCPECLLVLSTDPLRHFRECSRRQPLPPGHPQADKPADPDAPRRWRHVDPDRSPGGGRPVGAPCYGAYFSGTDLCVGDMGVRGTGAPTGVEWLDPDVRSGAAVSDPTWWAKR